jgi:hypothetical protein
MRWLPAPAAAAGDTVLRVKTSALPITLSGQPGSASDPTAWHTTQDNAEALCLQRVGAEGQVLARLQARPPLRA